MNKPTVFAKYLRDILLSMYYNQVTSDCSNDACHHSQTCVLRVSVPTHIDPASHPLIIADPSFLGHIVYLPYTFLVWGDGGIASVE